MVFVLARLIGLSPSSPQSHAGPWATQAPLSTLHPLSHHAQSDGSALGLVRVK